jgi:RNA polymerase sigma-70 factor (ECF subfamily)
MAGEIPAGNLLDTWRRMRRHTERAAAPGCRYDAPRRGVRTDEELMAAYAGGDAAAFEELFRRYAPLLERLMLRELYAREEANDLVQQTFLQLHRARLDFDASQRFKPWLYTIALNLKREHFRRRRRRPEVLGDAADERPGPAGAHETLEAQRSLAWALAQIPEENRSVIELHWFDGLSFAEIAKMLGIGAVAAKVRAHRGYQRLRKLLAGDLASGERGNRARGSGI